MAFLSSILSTLAHALPSTRARRLLILIYHRVHPQPDPMFPGEVDAERFEWQMALLRRYCEPMPLADGVQGLRTDNLPPRAVAVTFDDGYADNAAVALPILERHGIAATFFIAPAYLNGGRMWNDSVIESIRRASDQTLDLAEFGLGVVNLAQESSRGAIAEAVLKTIKHLSPEAREARVRKLCGQIGAELPTDLMMTDAQVRQVAAAGVEIGAHTMTHPILRVLSDEAARMEIEGSRTALEQIIGAPVRAFAYPNGRPGDDYTLRDRNLVESLGFDYAPSTTWGVASAESDRFQLPRFTPWDRTPPRWLGRLLLAFRHSA